MKRAASRFSRLRWCCCWHWRERRWPRTREALPLIMRIVGKTYTIYRIFNLNSHNTDYSAINYTVSEKWTAFFAEGAPGRTYVDIDKTYGYVVWKTGASPANFAAEAIKFAADKGIAHDGQAVAAPGTVKFDDLALGYYLVKSDLGALCSLDTTMPNVTIKEKNSESTVDKQVQEDSTGDYGDHNDADIGQTVNFRTTIYVVDGEPKNYVLHDTMSAGLTFDPASVAVTIGERTLAKNTDYTLVTSGLTDGCTFEVQFKDGVLKPNDVVEVAYSAEVNEYAVIGGTGNDNKTHLTYSDTPKSTGERLTKTYVWQFDVFKYAMRDGKEIPLAGAQFVLYKTVNDEKFYAQAANGKITGWTDDQKYATVFETPDNGKFVIAGLDADTYYLEETKAPDGYNRLKEPVNVVITANIASGKTVTATITYNETATGTVRIENQTGVELPSTGGIGTTVFYVIGGLLMGVAVVLLVTRKKMSTSK